MFLRPPISVQLNILPSEPSGDLRTFKEEYNNTFKYLVRREVQLPCSKESKIDREFSSDYLDLRKQSQKMVSLCFFKLVSRNDARNTAANC